MRAYQSVFALISAVWFLQLAGGILGIVTPLGLQTMGLNTTWIGVIAALHATGFMIGAAYAPRIIRRIGNIRCFSVAAAICGIGSLLLFLAPTATGWALVRVFQGIGFAMMFTAAEAWLGEAIEPEQRGGVMGFYHVIAKLALFTGPVLVIGYSAMDPGNYILAGIFLASALIPICLTYQPEPSRAEVEPQSVRSLVRRVPSAAIGVFLAGVINTGTLALLPIFAGAFALGGQETNFVVLTYAVANAGGLISQWPIGRLSDYIDRRTVIAAMAVVSGAAAIALGMMSDDISQLVMLGLLALWGAGSLSFYGISVAHGIDRVRTEEVTELMSGLLFVWATGSVVGPIVSGLAMRAGFGAPGLFLAAGALLFVLAASMLVRRAAKAGPKDAAQEDWNLTAPMSVAGAELDPRAPDDLLS